MSHVTISPAYGRDYKNGKAAQMDFDQGKDFRDESLNGGGRVCNKEDLVNAGVKEVHIRYKKLTMVKVVKL